MKATGIVRRIDDLGRVVVPKEIRKTLRIREGDPLEIFTDREGKIILKKVFPGGRTGGECSYFSREYCKNTGLYRLHYRSGSGGCSVGGREQRAERAVYQ